MYKIKHLCKFHPVQPVFEILNNQITLRCNYPSSGDFPGVPTWYDHPECHGCLVFYKSKAQTPELAAMKWDEYMETWNNGTNPDWINAKKLDEKEEGMDEQSKN